MIKIKQKSIQINYKAQLLKIDQVSGMYYTVPGRKTKRIVIYGIGAPLPPDEGKLSDADVILDYDTDLYVPDYIGYGRSNGRFTPMNCIQTFLNLYAALTKGCTAICSYAGLKKKLQYDEIHFVGRSFGGTYVLLLPRFKKQIKNLCVIFPMVDWRNIGKTKNHPEETVSSFYKAMREDGYRYLYRGILNSIWEKSLAGKDDLNPIDNIRHLKSSNIFIGHGKKDNNIYYGNSVNYYRKILRTFPKNKNQFKLKLYPFDHSKRTSNMAVVDYLKWAHVPKFSKTR